MKKTNGHASVDGLKMYRGLAFMSQIGDIHFA
jgi:hypothetical protein